MVTTRAHDAEASSAVRSPSKRIASMTASPDKSPRKRPSRGTLVPELPLPSTRRSASPSPSPNPTPSKPRATAARRSSGWSHTPSQLTLLWLAVSIPLVIWDTGYVFLRPHSMPGGKYVWPFYQPYQLYGRIDYIYGVKAWDDRNGFTAAQAALNVVETLGYGLYLYLVFVFSHHESVRGRGAPSKQVVGKLAESRTLHGRVAAFAALLGFAASVMTMSKTVLYGLNEAFGGFANVGHNDLHSLVFLWIIPNGLWIVLPTYMVYVFGAEILQGLEIASASSKKIQ